MTINYSISETKYNTLQEKRKLNEKMKAREKLYQVVFSYFMKKYSYGKRTGQGNKGLFPSF